MAILGRKDLGLAMMTRQNQVVARGSLLNQSLKEKNFDWRRGGPLLQSVRPLSRRAEIWEGGHFHTDLFLEPSEKVHKIAPKRLNAPTKLSLRKCSAFIRKLDQKPAVSSPAGARMGVALPILLAREIQAETEPICTWSRARHPPERPVQFTVGGPTSLRSGRSRR
jgi:hypothetical protein